MSSLPASEAHERGVFSSTLKKINSILALISQDLVSYLSFGLHPISIKSFTIAIDPQQQA